MKVLDPFTHALTIYCIFHTGLVAGADMIELAKRVKKRRNHREKLKAVENANRNVPVQDGMIPRPGIIALLCLLISFQIQKVLFLEGALFQLLKRITILTLSYKFRNLPQNFSDP
jgi:hypothetical protein